MGVSRNPAMPVSGSPAYSPDSLPVYRGGGDSAPPAWTPDEVLVGVTNSFWARPLDASVLYQDASLTTPADETADPIGGVDNQSAIGTATLSQATTADKLEVGASGRIARVTGGATSTKSLDFNSLILTQSDGYTLGFLVQRKVDQLAYIVSAAGDLVVELSTSSVIRVRVGGTTYRDTKTGIVNDVDYRIIVVGDNTAFSVFVDGEEFGPFAPQAVATFNNFVIGALSKTGTALGGFEIGRHMIARKKFIPAEVLQLDAWLGGA